MQVLGYIQVKCNHMFSTLSMSHKTRHNPI